MLTSLIRAVSNNITTNLAHFRKLNSVGLNPVRVKYLKVVNNTSLNFHKLFGRKVYYINNFDLLHSLKELFIEEVYKISLAPGALVIDCGANIGLSAIYFKHNHPDVKVIAFEPDNTNFSLLEKNIASFGINADVTARKEAVWTETGTISFKSVGSLGSCITSNDDKDAYSIPCVRLKDLLTQPVALLKMDIEGAEYNVLMDIKENLHLVENIFIEYHGTFDNQDQLSEILQMLFSLGYRYYLKEAFDIFPNPFYSHQKSDHPYDIQLNIFCFRG